MAKKQFVKIAVGFTVAAGCLMMFAMAVWVRDITQSRQPVVGPFSVAELIAGRQFTPSPRVLPAPSPDVYVRWPTVTPNATLVAMTFDDRVAFVLDAVRRDRAGYPMTLTASAALTADEAPLIGLNEEQVRWGSEPDVALVVSARDISGNLGYYLFVWDATYSSLVKEAMSFDPIDVLGKLHWNSLKLP